MSRVSDLSGIIWDSYGGMGVYLVPAGVMLLAAALFRACLIIQVLSAQLCDRGKHKIDGKFSFSFSSVYSVFSVVNSRACLIIQALKKVTTKPIRNGRRWTLINAKNQRRSIQIMKICVPLISWLSS